MSAVGPLGVFDSGMGGLTVVREILRHLPGEEILYIADTAHVPYGGRPQSEIRDFTLGIGRYLTETANCRAVVIACNTATAAAADDLRRSLSVPVVGMEPGVKPAVAATRTKRVGVLATVSTLSADRFAALVARFAGDVTVITQPCPSLVECVEAGDLDSPKTRALVEQYVRPLIERDEVDTLVLGCTHYPLLRPLLQEVAGPKVTLLDTSGAVARQVVRVAGRGETSDNNSRVRCLSTGGEGRAPDAVARLARRFLGDEDSGGERIDLRPGGLRWHKGELYDDGDSTK